MELAILVVYGHLGKRYTKWNPFGNRINVQ